MDDQHPRRADQVAARIIDGNAVLVSPESSQLYWLNPVATRVWELATGEHTVADIAGQLCEEFDVERERAEADVREMVQTFVDGGMLSLA